MIQKEILYQRMNTTKIKFRKMKMNIIVLFLFLTNNLFAQEKYTIIIPTKYLECQIKNNNTIIGYTSSGYDERSGDFYNLEGKLILENATKINIYNNGIIGFLDNKKNYCFLNKDNKIINTNQKITNKNINADGDEFITYKNSEGKLIFIDYLGKEIIKPTNFDAEIYTLVKYLGHQNWAIKLKNTEDDDLDIDWLLYNHCGLLTPKGIIIEPKELFFITEYFNGISEIFKDDKYYGYLKTDGSYVLEPILEQSDHAFSSNENITTYIKNERKGFIFDLGNMVIEADYDLVGVVFPFKDLFFVTKNGKYGAFDATGKIVLPFQFSDHVEAYETISGIRVKEAHQLYGYSDLSAKTIIEPQFSWAYPFYKNYGIVSNRQKKYSILDKTGAIQMPFKFDDIASSDLDKVFFVKQNGKAGVILLK